MSNIFAPYARHNGGLVKFNIGTGPLVSPVKNQHLNIDSSGAIYAVQDGVTNHYGAGLPFDVDGRLNITLNAPDYFDQGVSFGANGALATGGATDHTDQGVRFSATGAIAAT